MIERNIAPNDEGLLGREINASFMVQIRFQTILVAFLYENRRD